MQYQNLTANERLVYKKINRTHSYSQLFNACINWLRHSSTYDATREGLNLFMTINDIPNDLDVPTKRSLVICLMLMHAQDFCEQQAMLISPEFVNRKSAEIFLEECLAIEI